MKARIQQTTQTILDTRAFYPDSSLVALYDQLTMPPELCKAYQNNDRAVMQAYGFSVEDMTESSCVAVLMKMYQTMVTKQKIYVVKVRRFASKNQKARHQGHVFRGLSVG